MIVIRLKDAMDRYKTRTGISLTYADLAAMSGLSRSAVESIASRENYNPTLSTVGKLCEVLDCPIDEMLHWRENED